MALDPFDLSADDPIMALLLRPYDGAAPQPPAAPDLTAPVSPPAAPAPGSFLKASPLVERRTPVDLVNTPGVRLPDPQDPTTWSPSFPWATGDTISSALYVLSRALTTAQNRDVEERQRQYELAKDGYSQSLDIYNAKRQEVSDRFRDIVSVAEKAYESDPSDETRNALAKALGDRDAALAAIGPRPTLPEYPAARPNFLQRLFGPRQAAPTPPAPPTGAAPSGGPSLADRFRTPSPLERGPLAPGGTTTRPEDRYAKYFVQGETVEQRINAMPWTAEQKRRALDQLAQTGVKLDGSFKGQGGNALFDQLTVPFATRTGKQWGMSNYQMPDSVRQGLLALPGDSSDPSTPRGQAWGRIQSAMRGLSPKSEAEATQQALNVIDTVHDQWQKQQAQRAAVIIGKIKDNLEIASRIARGHGTSAQVQVYLDRARALRQQADAAGFDMTGAPELPRAEDLILERPERRGRETGPASISQPEVINGRTYRHFTKRDGSEGTQEFINGHWVDISAERYAHAVGARHKPFDQKKYDAAITAVQNAFAFDPADTGTFNKRAMEFLQIATSMGMSREQAIKEVQAVNPKWTLSGSKPGAGKTVSWRAAKRNHPNVPDEELKRQLREQGYEIVP